MLQNVQQAISSGRWAKRLSEAGDQAYQAGVRDKGRGRYTGGVTTQRAVQKVTTHGQKLASVLSGVNLPPRGAKGSNYGRVQAIGDALMAGFGTK